MALNDLFCADLPLRNYSLTFCFQSSSEIDQNRNYSADIEFRNKRYYFCDPPSTSSTECVTDFGAGVRPQWDRSMARTPHDGLGLGLGQTDLLQAVLSLCIFTHTAWASLFGHPCWPSEIHSRHIRSTASNEIYDAMATSFQRSQIKPATRFSPDSQKLS